MHEFKHTLSVFASSPGPRKVTLRARALGSRVVVWLLGATAIGCAGADDGGADSNTQEVTDCIPDGVTCFSPTPGGSSTAATGEGTPAPENTSETPMEEPGPVMGEPMMTDPPMPDDTPEPAMEPEMMPAEPEAPVDEDPVDEEMPEPEMTEEPEEEVPMTDYCAATEGWDPMWAQWEEEVLVLVNEYRAAGADCGDGGIFDPAEPLEMDPLLRCSSRVHSLDMFERGFFDHTNPDGDDPFDRIEEAGFEGSAMGENIAQGYSDPQDVMAGWMDSDGHCSNIMSPNYTLIGVGYHAGDTSTRFGDSHYWTQNFGAPPRGGGGGFGFGND